MIVDPDVPSQSSSDCARRDPGAPFQPRAVLIRFASVCLSKLQFHGNGQAHRYSMGIEKAVFAPVFLQPFSQIDDRGDLSSVPNAFVTVEVEMTHDSRGIIGGHQLLALLLGDDEYRKACA